MEPNVYRHHCMYYAPHLEYIQNKALKEQRKADTESIDGVLSSIRVLSREKDELTQQLGAENDKLRAKIDTVVAERDAFLKESRGIVELLVQQGLHQQLASSQNISLRGSIESLMKERAQHKRTIEELQAENAKHLSEREEGERLRKEYWSCQEKVRALETEVESLKGKEKRSEKVVVGAEKESLQF